MASDIIVRISGNIDDFDKALDQVSAKSEGLEDKLGKVAIASGAAFAALTAEVYLSTKAYAVEEQALREVTVALANQGMYTDKLAASYRSYADEIEAKTGVDGDAISVGQAMAQSLMGQIVITEDLTKAVVDFATAQKMDVGQAFELVGKSIGTNTNALQRYGVHIDENASKQDKMSQIVDVLSKKYAGQAQAAAEGSGATKLLSAEFGNLQKQIGSAFAPMVATASKALAEFIGRIRENKPVMDLVTALTAAGLVVAGLGTAGAAAGLGVLKLKAALEAAKIATTATSIAVKGLIGAAGIGLLVVIASEIYMNWSSIWPRMQAIFQAFVDNIGTLGDGLAQILKGVFTFDSEAIRAGLDQAKQAFVEGYQDYAQSVAEAEEGAHQQKIADDQRRAAELNANRQIAGDQETQQARELKEKINQLEKQTSDEKLSNQAKEHVLYNQEQQKFGKTYADINKALRSDEVKGAKQMFGEMAELQNSNNATLKAAGKAAALANIGIKTAEGATAAFAGAVALLGPLAGPPVGTAVAAAIIAYGAEQAGKVLGMAKGGLVAGGVSGVDSVPIMGQAGELMAPRQNFEEVIGSVRAAREAEKLADRGILGGSGDASMTLVLELRDNLMDFIEAKLVERRGLNLSLQGV